MSSQVNLTVETITVKQQPLVSVVIPTYNRPSYLKAALKSAVEQTYQNIEIIVSDNCSLENPQTMDVVMKKLGAESIN